MDFECDFNYLNFCQYSNLGWGFEKSVHNERKTVKQSSNYFPCSTKTDFGSKLEKKVSLNISQSLCLRFAYLLEEKGQITVTNGKSKWSRNASGPFSQWNYIRFPLTLQQSEHSPTVTFDSTVLQITGESVCVDNFTISSEQCPLTPSGFDNNFSSNKTLWLSQPLSVLIAIVTLVVLFVLVGLLASVLCARRSQRALSRSKPVPRKLQRPRHSFPNSVEIGTTINSSCDADTVDSCRPFTQTFFLPTVVHVRSSSQLVRYSRQSFAVSSSIETRESTPQCRFSLALTEDAQLQLLTNHEASSPVATDLSCRQFGTFRHQSLSHENSPSPNEIWNSQRPNSIVVAPNICTPIVDQSESDLSLESAHRLSMVSDPRRRDGRRRPIRETTNIGYMSDSSLCDLPQYDTAVQLLAEHRIKLAQSPDLIEDNEDGNNNDLFDDGHL